jgi:energy-coupling factor transporter ATP-binding protein EcfA2
VLGVGDESISRFSAFRNKSNAVQTHNRGANMAFHLKRWNPDTMKQNSTVLIIGKRGAGKSSLLVDMMYYLHMNGHIDFCIGFSPTEEANQELSKFIPRTLIHTSYKPGIIERVYEAQRRASKRSAKLQRVCIILDDCMWEKSAFNTDIVRRLFFNSRHYNITLILTAQYCMDLPPALRSNIDIVMCARDLVVNNRERLFKNFFGIFEDFKKFNRVMLAATEDFQFLMIVNNDSRSTKAEDLLFHYRADITLRNKRFRVGRKIYWKYNDRVGIDEDARRASVATLDATNRVILEK